MLQLKLFKIDEKCFYFILEALFVVKIFKFLSGCYMEKFGIHMEKWLNKKATDILKVYGVTTWKTKQLQ